MAFTRHLLLFDREIASADSHHAVTAGVGVAVVVVVGAIVVLVLVFVGGAIVVEGGAIVVEGGAIVVVDTGGVVVVVVVGLPPQGTGVALSGTVAPLAHCATMTVPASSPLE
ncbi:MAG: hypothetical protein ACK5O2_00690, partial [Microthrixaceae bacterium]